MAAIDLDPQFGKLPPEQRKLAAISARIDSKAMAQKGAEAKLDATDTFKSRMSFLHDRALHNAYFESEVIKKITDEEVRARYDKELAATPPENEMRARHILVKTIEEAQDIIKQLDGGASFEELAKAKSTDVEAVLDDGTTIRKDVHMDLRTGAISSLGAERRADLPAIFTRQLRADVETAPIDLQSISRLLKAS